MPLNESSLLKKASCFLQNDALIAILIVKGREAVFWKACDELCHVVGSEKTRMRRTCVKKAKEKSGFWLETFPCVSGQTLKQGSNHFTIGQTRISGFGLKCTGCSDLELGGNLHQCLWFGDTGKKTGRGVFWISTSRKFQPKPSNTGCAF